MVTFELFDQAWPALNRRSLPSRLLRPFMKGSPHGFGRSLPIFLECLSQDSLCEKVFDFAFCLASQSVLLLEKIISCHNNTVTASLPRFTYLPSILGRGILLDRNKMSAKMLVACQLLLFILLLLSGSSEVLAFVLGSLSPRLSWPQKAITSCWIHQGKASGGGLTLTTGSGTKDGKKRQALVGVAPQTLRISMHSAAADRQGAKEAASTLNFSVQEKRACDLYNVPGLVPYTTALEWQKSLQAERIRFKLENKVLFSFCKEADIPKLCMFLRSDCV
jgi:hypothetical protein